MAHTSGVSVVRGRTPSPAASGAYGDIGQATRSAFGRVVAGSR